MKIKAKQTRVPYTKEERIAMFVEGKIKVPTLTSNKKKFNKAKERRKNKGDKFEYIF